MSPRWNCWPTTAAGSITARPRGPSRSRRASSKAWIEVGTDRDRRSAASSDSTARSSPSAVRSRPRPEVGDQLLDQQREALGPLADVGLDGLVDPAAEQVDDQLLALPLGQGRAGTTAHWPCLLASGRRVNSSSGRAMHSSTSGASVYSAMSSRASSRIGSAHWRSSMTSTRAGGGPGSPAAAAAPRGVLGQVGALAEAEQLGDPLGDERCPARHRRAARPAGSWPAWGSRRGDPGRLPDDLDHRPQGDAPEGRAVPAQDLGLVAEAADELVDQARLADPGRAEDADQVAGPSAAARSNSRSSSCSRPRLEQGPAGRLRPGRSGSTSSSRQTFCGSAAPLTVSGPAGSASRRRPPAGTSPRRGGPPRAGQLLEPLGQVDGRAGELLLERAGVADQHVAGVDAEADVEVEAALAAHLLGQLVQGGGARRPPARPAGRRPRAARGRRRRP